MNFRLSKCIAVNVKDYEKAIAFYRDTLGWELVKYTPTESQFNKGELTFFIEASDKPYDVFFEYEVDNFEEAKAKLLSEGCTIRQEYSTRNMMFTDPYGMNFHVYEKGLDLPGI